MTRFFTQRSAQFAIAGAVAAFAWSLAQNHPEASTAVESRFLALVLGLTFGALAMASRSAPAVMPGGALVALALCLPAADGTRGTLVMALLVATAGFATWRTFIQEERLALLDVAALAVAWQCILRSERLLDLQSSPRSLLWLLAWLVALPVAAAVATWWHSRRHGGASALALLAGMTVLGPGLGVVAVAVLVSVAALTGRRGRSWPAAAIAAASCIAAIGWSPDAGPSLLVLAAVLALRHQAPYAWVAAGATLLWAAVVTVGIGGAEGTGGPASAGAWLVFAVPLAVLAPAAKRPLWLAGLALALAYPLPAAPAMLAPALALALVALPTERSPRLLQASWSLALLALAAGCAAYPWLRQPIVFLLQRSVPAAVVAGALVVLASSQLLLAERRRQTTTRRTPTPILVAALGLSIGLATFIWQPRKLNSEPIRLTANHGTWQTAEDASAVRRVTVDSFVTRGEALEAGQPVAFVVLTAADGSRQRLTLRQGLETSDWAARRLTQVAAPPAWLHWLAGDGTLAQRYRASWRLETPLDLVSLEVVRAGDLAPKAELAVLAVAVR